MKKTARFSWKKRALSFRYAWNGIRYAFRTQHNMWLHATAAVLAILLALALPVTKLQWMVILFCIALVFSLEMINTAIELLADHLHPEQHPEIGRVKDLAAGAVLVAAVTAFIVGCWIFVPKLIDLF